ncbi:MAG: site-2 protease family protein [Bacillota bacterium]
MRSEIMLYIYAIPAILISLSFHEMSHAYASYRQGDPTAKRLGRLTMNPLKHLDPVGTLMLIVSMVKGFGFGWAKPVPIDPTYYRNQRRGTIIVSLAGPVSNLLLAFIFSIPMAYIAIKNGYTPVVAYNTSVAIFGANYSFEAILFNISRFFYIINIGLATFNILPVPPLDGSKILTAILPVDLYFKLLRYERYIGLVFLGLILVMPGILYTVLTPVKRLFEVILRLVAMPILGLLT